MLLGICFTLLPTDELIANIIVCIYFIEASVSVVFYPERLHAADDDVFCRLAT